jgi:hypothetical protein
MAGAEDRSERVSAEYLRATAQMMRNMAGAASSGGRWSATLPGKGSAWVEVPGYEHAISAHGFPDEAEHIAAWDPAVARVVADWLDLAADYAVPDPHGEDEPCVDCALVRGAHAVAKAYRRDS